MQELVLKATQLDQWHTLVNEAQQNADCSLDQELESYLIFLLIRFSTNADMANRYLGLDFLESLQQQGRQRLSNLKDVGDHCLLFSGLFPQIAKRRRVKISYFVDLGRSAYRQLSDQARSSEHALFHELAHRFVLLMDVLLTIRSMDNTKTLLEPLQAYELWNDTGSQSAGKILNQSHGAIIKPQNPAVH